MRLAFICTGRPDNLKYFDNSTTKIITLLKKYDWSVESILLQNRKILNLNLQKYKGKTIEEFLFFYIGHGHSTNKRRVLKLQLHYDTIEINHIIESIEEILNPTKQAIILDACYSGNYKDISLADLAQSIEILSSSQEDQLSYECNILKNSVFSYFFCEAIEELDGLITIKKIVDYLEPKMKEHAKKLEGIEKQEPLLLSLGSNHIIITDKEYFKVKNKIDIDGKFIVDYLKQQKTTKETLLTTCKKFLDKNLYLIIRKYKNITKIVNHLYKNKMFPCIIQELYTDDNNEIKEWLNYNLNDCIDTEELLSPRLIIIFKKYINNTYEITFRSKDLSMINDENNSITIDFNNDISKQILIKKIIDYISIYNPKVDLILPFELMKESINLWENKRYHSLSRLSQLNIRSLQRYDIGDSLLRKKIEQNWKNIQEKISNNKSLYSIMDKNSMEDIGSNMEEVGVASRVILDDKNFDFLLKTDMSYILLWMTKECSKELKELYKEDITQLPKNYYLNIKNSPISLMWDDPSTNYYPKGDDDDY